MNERENGNGREMSMNGLGGKKERSDLSDCVCDAQVQVTPAVLFLDARSHQTDMESIQIVSERVRAGEIGHR